MLDYLKENVRFLFSNFLDIVYDNKGLCIICKKNSGFEDLCELCSKTIIIETRKFKSKNGNNVYCLGHYSGGIKELVRLFKYKKRFSCGKYLGEIASEEVKKLDEKFDYITFVPSGVKSLRKRGFNQSKLLAQKISRKIKVECIECYIKTEETEKQATLKRRDREKNLEKTFKYVYDKSLKDKNILIVDDVYTTGSTINALTSLNFGKESGNFSILTIAKSRL